MMAGLPTPRNSIELPPISKFDSSSGRGESVKRASSHDYPSAGTQSAKAAAANHHLSPNRSQRNTRIEKTPKRHSAEFYLRKLSSSGGRHPHEYGLDFPPEPTEAEEPPYLPSSYGLQSSVPQGGLMSAFHESESNAIRAVLEFPITKLELAAYGEEAEMLHKPSEASQLQATPTSGQVSSDTQAQSMKDAFPIAYVDLGELITQLKRVKNQDLGILQKPHHATGEVEFVDLSADQISQNPELAHAAESGMPICEEMFTSDITVSRPDHFIWSEEQSLGSEDRTEKALSSSIGMQSDVESTAASEALLSLAGAAAGYPPPVCVFVAQPQVFAFPCEVPRFFNSSGAFLQQPWYPLPFGGPSHCTYAIPMPGTAPPNPPPSTQHARPVYGPQAPSSRDSPPRSDSSDPYYYGKSGDKQMLHVAGPMSPLSLKQEEDALFGHDLKLQGIGSDETDAEESDTPEDIQDSSSEYSPEVQGSQLQRRARQVRVKEETCDDSTIERPRKQRKLLYKKANGRTDTSLSEDNATEDEDETAGRQMALKKEESELGSMMFKYPKIPPPELRGTGVKDRPTPVFRDANVRPQRVTGIKSDPDLEAKARLHIKGVQQCGSTCPREFATLVKMAAHLDDDHSSAYRRWLCPEKSCIWSLLGFHKKVECARHIKGQHSNVMYKCTHCCRQFARSDSYRRHFTTAHRTLLP